MYISIRIQTILQISDSSFHSRHSKITSGARYCLVFMIDYYYSFLYVAPPKSIILTVSSNGRIQTYYLNRLRLDLIASTESYGIRPRSEDPPPMFPPVHPSICVPGYSSEKRSSSLDSDSSTFSPS